MAITSDGTVSREQATGGLSRARTLRPDVRHALGRGYELYCAERINELRERYCGEGLRRRETELSAELDHIWAEIETLLKAGESARRSCASTGTVRASLSACAAEYDV